ncbi:hypothetical protein L873DRAFT_1802187 [Choiromyces venosus 120613-1]|uniref:Uncharacterized protein n=1 Tax=Choiromyces venosus 120613-1 TaxID=1336337 RepID=A0A3N4JYE1_9PEZI|nr:hypothetical protein L873DRAFT_1802187 [Choiromyces venosus 120613-1]
MTPVGATEPPDVPRPVEVGKGIKPPPLRPFNQFLIPELQSKDPGIMPRGQEAGPMRKCIATRNPHRIACGRYPRPVLKFSG